MGLRSGAQPIRYDAEPLVTVRVLLMVELVLLPVHEGGIASQGS